ncbi:MAG: ferrous iron transport protein B [Armatimonadetes bacterium]|nr:ferrous iron transport protein B [Armatimonadota bacterium]
MPVGCHDAQPRIPISGDLQVALAGNPNVGKSTVFNSLTGLGSSTANYPGTTVEVSVATARVNGSRVTILDLPGTYALSGHTEDQQAARRALLEERPDAVAAILDATNLARNLYLVLQLLDLGFRVVVALNLTDEAARRGIHIDAGHLGALLGVPVVPTIATRRRGTAELLTEAMGVVRRPMGSMCRYSAEVEGMAARVEALLDDHEVPARGRALLLLEEGTLDRLPSGMANEEAAAEAAAIAREASERGAEPLPLAIARERHLEADRIAREVTLRPGTPQHLHLWRLATRPSTGVPMLLAVLAATFAGLFWGGSLLAGLVETLWARTASPAIAAVSVWAFGDGVITRILKWGLDAGLLAVLTVGIPYVLTFYLLLSILEDSGYLNVAAVLTDRLMGRLGLNGRAAIPLVAGAGCSVPAILGLRVLRTERERLIGGTLVALVPCSARTAVIVGAVAYLGGWRAAVLLYLTVAAVILATGWGLNRLLPGRAPDLIMEIFPFRWPTPPGVLRKAWARAREFVTVAVPVVLVGSFVLGALYETGLVRLAERPLAPIVEGWLGLPAVAGLTLIFAVLRKELALQLLVALAVMQYGSGASSLSAFMTPNQVFTYALVNTIYIPCIATMAVLAKVLGWRRSAAISGFTIALALAVGGLATRLLALLGFG